MAPPAPHPLGSLGAPRDVVDCLGMWWIACTWGGGIHANFFVPPPLRRYSPEKKLAPHVGIFFAKRNFFIVCYLNLHVTFTLPHCMTLAHELLLRQK